MRVFGLPKPIYQVSRLPPVHLSDKAKEHWRYLSCWHALRKKGLCALEASHKRQSQAQTPSCLLARMHGTRLSRHLQPILQNSGTTHSSQTVRL